MPLPGLNPVDSAPPAGSTGEVATGSMVARLHHRITELRHVVDKKSEISTHRAEITWNSGYWMAYNADRSPESNYTGLVVVKEGNVCSFEGLFKSNTAWNGGVSSSYQNMFTLPVGFRPTVYVMGLLHGLDNAGNRFLVAADMSHTGVVSMRYADGVIAGTSTGSQIFMVAQFTPWLVV